MQLTIRARPLRTSSYRWRREEKKLAIVPKNNKTIAMKMKISEVIKKLQEIQEEYGDLEVESYDDYEYVPTDEYSFLVNDNKLYIRG